jgi:NADH-quinone oxidoreductase subunit M
MAYFLLAATFLPLLMSPVSYILGKRIGINAVTWFSFGILAISTALLFIPAATLRGGQSAYVESYPWSQFGNFGLRLDGLSLPFAMIIYILCTVLALYSKPYMIHKIMEDVHGHIGSGGSSGSTSTSGPSGQATSIVDRSQQQHVQNQMALYFALYMTFSMGMLGTVLATNLIEFFVFFELMLVPSFFLIAFYGYGARLRIALMFFFWTHVGAVVLLLGLLAMGFFAGGFDYAIVKANVAKIPAQWLSIIVFALVVGLGVKLAEFL